MRLIILISVLIFSTISLHAQISTVNRKVDSVKVEIIKYDTTMNWLGAKNVNSYVGQTLYVAEDNKSVREYGYGGFYKEKDPTYLDKARYGNPAPKSEYNTRFEDLNGMYFLVKEVHKDKWHSSFGKWWFLLQDTTNPDVEIWFEYSEKYEHSWPFVVLSYFEYSKKEYIGKSYVTRLSERKPLDDKERTEYGDKIQTSIVGKRDINTNQVIHFTVGEIWQCYDVSVVDGSVAMLVKNSKGNVTDISISSLIGYDGDPNAFEKTQYDKYLNKFGKTNMYRILREEIAVGMTTEMLKLSWGEPDDINRTSYGKDQWVYDGQYVYIENGKITAWN